ncbi:hypothetical protein A7982_13569 [Minicystis rosea]|nr:hypothetical protein A7982_13569 [Minicystis rosea]
MTTRVVDQRERRRARVWLPIRVRWEGGEGVAVTYDASDKGVLLLMAEPLAVGTRVSVTFEVPGEPGKTALKERTGAGRVVRAGPNEEDPHGLWPHRVAVALDEAVEAFAEEIGPLSREHPLADTKR